MSGYRTPYYNARIGNETGLSRHLYGYGAIEEPASRRRASTRTATAR